jgi:hypothetical protein
MGCDVHMYAEYKRGSKWVKAGKRFKNGWYSSDRPLSSYNTPLTDRPYSDRNYDLFGMLADVRNGRGFAGVKTGEGFVPIDIPRGLPKDVTKAIKKMSDRWGCDGHSHSYLYLSELLDYNWNQVSELTGEVSLEEYRVFKRDGHPQSWCGDITGATIIKVTNEEMDELLNNPPENADRYFTRIFWQESYHEAAGSFFTKTIAALQGLGKPEDVRIVFWFDN